MESRRGTLREREQCRTNACTQLGASQHWGGTSTHFVPIWWQMSAICLACALSQCAARQDTVFCVCGLLASSMVITRHWPFDPGGQFQFAFYHTFLKSGPWEQFGNNLACQWMYQLLFHCKTVTLKSRNLLPLGFLSTSHSKMETSIVLLPRVIDRPQFLSSHNFFVLSWPGYSDLIFSFQDTSILLSLTDLCLISSAFVLVSTVLHLKRSVNQNWQRLTLVLFRGYIKNTFSRFGAH